MNDARPPFDVVTMWLHWLTLALIVAMFATAWLHEGAADAASARALLTAHRSLGVLVWITTLGRLAWRLTRAYLPPFPARMGRAQRTAAKLSEYALYALLLLQPITGMAQTIYRGRPFELFFLNVGPLAPRDRALVSLTHDIHHVGALVFIALIGLHACAALFHHFVLRDGVLASMAPAIAGKSAGPQRALNRQPIPK